MTEMRVPRGSRVRLGAVDGDLRADENVRIEVDGRVVVAGTARFDGDADILGDLQCRSFTSDDGTVHIAGSLVVEDSVHSRDGTLEVDGEMRARRVDIDRGLRVKGPAAAEEFEVGGVLDGGSTLHATRISVGGKFRLVGKLTAESVETGGSVDVGDVELETLEAGGLIHLHGGTVRGSIEVGGRFVADAPLTFGSLEAGGFAELKGDGTGGSLAVGGVFTARANLTFTKLKVGGMGSIGGNAQGESVEVGGKFDVGGRLRLTRTLEVGGFMSVGEELFGDRLELGGALTARRVVLASIAEIGGRVATQEGLKAARVVLQRKSRASGPVVGDSVELEDRARADDVYGQTVDLGEKSEVRRVFAARLRVRSGATVDEAVYTESADIDPGARLRAPPRRVDALPPFPL